jgi:putative membrane protein
MLSINIAASLTGIGSFFAHFAASIVLLIIFSFIYVMVTPYREIELIGQGNTAAACSYSGALMGFVIPMASAIAHSVGLVDMIVWGIVALVVQLITFFVVRLLFPAIVADIPANQVSKGIFLGAVSIAVGILNAAAMTY